jgi:hypothetical protein
MFLIQRDLDEIVNMCNCHQIRRQPQNKCPSGVSPNVLYYQPKIYNGVNCGYPLPCEVNDIDLIAQMYTTKCPTFGCKAA